MTSYLFQFTVRMIGMLTVYVQLLWQRQVLYLLFMSPSLCLLPSYLSLRLLYVTFSVPDLFSPSICIDSIDIFFPSSSQQHTTVKPLRSKQHLPAKTENVNCNLIKCEVFLSVMDLQRMHYTCRHL